MRGVAALSVVVYHVWLYTTVDSGNPRTPGDWVLRQGYLGLVLFFVLSGFLLYSPWLRAALESRPAPRLGRYVKSRLGRIAPAYYVALGGTLVLLLTTPPGTPGLKVPDLSQLPLFLVFAQNLSDGTLLKLDAPMWTLAIEVSFYVALPLIGVLAIRSARTRRRQVLFVLGVAALAIATRSAALGLPARHPLLWSLPAYIDYFACGMLAAVLVHGRVLRRSTCWLLFGFGVVAVVANGLLQDQLRTDPNLQIVRDLPAALGLAALVAVAAASHAPRRILASRPLERVGHVSYGLYLWHLPLIVWMRGHGLFPNDLVTAVAAVLPPALAIAAASWHLVERPALARVRGKKAAPKTERTHPEEHARRPGDSRRPVPQAA